MNGYTFHYLVGCTPWTWKCRWQVQLDHVRATYAPNASSQLWVLFVDGDSFVVEPTSSLSPYLRPTDGNPVQLHWRENGEVTASCLLARMGHPSAEDFISRWMNKSFTAANADNGDLLELLLEISTLPSEGSRNETAACLRLRREGADYGLFNSCFFSAFRDSPDRFDTLRRVGVTIHWPGAGFWRSLECGGFVGYEDRLRVLAGDVIGHGCKRQSRYFNKSDTCAGVLRLNSLKQRDTPSEEARSLARRCLHLAHGCFVAADVGRAPAGDRNLCQELIREASCNCTAPHMLGGAPCNLREPGPLKKWLTSLLRGG